MKIARVLDKWMRWPLVVALGLGWTLMSWVEYRSMLVEEYGVDTTIVERYYDRELRLLEATDRAGPYGKWIVGAEDEPELLREQRATIRETYLSELGEDGTDMLDLIALELGETETTWHDYSDETYRTEVYYRYQLPL